MACSLGKPKLPKEDHRNIEAETENVQYYGVSKAKFKVPDFHEAYEYYAGNAERENGVLIGQFGFCVTGPIFSRRTL